jgi:hypothetical protein
MTKLSQRRPKLLEGYWFCLSHGGPCERIEGEQGQPAHCETCGSHRLKWNPPVFSLAGSPTLSSHDS